MKQKYLRIEDVFRDRLVCAMLIRACKDYILIKKHHLRGMRGVGSLAEIRAFMKEFELLWVLDRIDEEMENGNNRFIFNE